MRVGFRDSIVEATELRRSILGEVAAVEVGDGIHITAPRGLVSIDATTVVANERVGLLVDIADSGALQNIRLAGVVADAFGTSLGAIAQEAGAVVRAGSWDLDVTRRGAALVNDVALATALEVNGAVAPDSIPRPEVTSVIE